MSETEWYTNSVELENFFEWMRDNDYDSSDLITMVQRPELYNDIYKEFREEFPLEEND